LVVVVVLGWFLSRDKWNINPGLSLQTEGIEIGATGPAVTGVSLVQNDGDRPVWSIKAPRAEQNLKTGVTTIYNPQLVLFQRNGNKLEANAKLGLMSDDKKRPMSLQGGVIVQDSFERTLTTDRIVFDPVSEAVTINGSFHIKSPEIEMTGSGAQFDRIAQRLKVTGRAKITYYGNNR